MAECLSMVEGAGLQFLFGRGLPLDEAIETTAIDFVEVALLYAGLLRPLSEASETGSVDFVEVALLGEAGEARSVDLVKVSLRCAEGHAAETKRKTCVR